MLTAAAVLFFFRPELAIAPALLYVVLCVAASFFPATNFLCPVVSRGNTGKNFVALTFDDGPDEPVTKQVLDLLDKYSVPATFFVTGVNAARFPEIIREIISRGHTVGNHSFHHYPFLMLKSSSTIYREIFTTQELLRKMGVHTIAFRPPVGIVNPKLALLLEELGLDCITFSCRAADRGNRRVQGISRRILKKAKADDIILLHDVTPRHEREREILLEEIENLLVGLKAREFKVVPLSGLIGKAIMSE